MYLSYFFLLGNDGSIYRLEKSSNENVSLQNNAEGLFSNLGVIWEFICVPRMWQDF